MADTLVERVTGRGCDVAQFQTPTRHHYRSTGTRTIPIHISEIETRIAITEAA
jgi:hypothetical protein